MPPEAADYRGINCFIIHQARLVWPILRGVTSIYLTASSVFPSLTGITQFLHQTILIRCYGSVGFPGLNDWVSARCVDLHDPRMSRLAPVEASRWTSAIVCKNNPSIVLGSIVTSPIKIICHRPDYLTHPEIDRSTYVLYAQGLLLALTSARLVSKTLNRLFLRVYQSFL